MTYFVHQLLGQAGIAQLGERQTEDLKVPGSIPGHGNIFRLIKLQYFEKVKL